MPASARPWTSPADVIALLRRRWETGAHLTAVAESAWQPICVPLHGPTATQLAQRFADAQDWARSWTRDASMGLRLEYASVGGRFTGANQIPSRAWIDEFDQLCTLLHVQSEAARFARMLDETRTSEPGLVEWVTAKPPRALRHAHEWPRVLATVAWLNANTDHGLYLRQIAVPGVDTKFIENRKALLADLIDAMPHGRKPAANVPRGDFAHRYGFLDKPEYIRFRHLDADANHAGFRELTVRAEEFQTMPPGTRRVYIVENEVTFLALPPIPHALAIFGSGYRVGAKVEYLPWLTDTELFYWGDVDTHGFAILNRMRAKHPHTKSILMDVETLLAHQDQWVAENEQARGKLDHLDAAETELYRTLIDGDLGPSIRLEQERIQYPLAEAALSLSASTQAAARPHHPTLGLGRRTRGAGEPADTADRDARRRSAADEAR